MVSSILILNYEKQRNTNAQIGGGYVVPAAPEFFEFMFRIVDFCKAQGKDVACLMPAYGTLPLPLLPPNLIY